MAWAMGFFGKIFTWWNGATLVTSMLTRLRGEEAGKDEFGNVYFRMKNGRRWVVYSGINDGSRVPPAWQAWLRGTIDDVPDKALPPRRKFEQDPLPNLTGTMAAFRPDGALGSGRTRPAATGDYQPWTPD